MLGRHVYRVHPADSGWAVIKDSETDPRGRFDDRAQALAEACRIAEADQPSRVVVDDGAGVLVEEHMFGSDLTEEFDTPQR